MSAKRFQPAKFAGKYTRQAQLPDAAYSKDFDEVTGKYNREKRWCKIHPFAIWGKKSNGEWYPRCVQGNRSNENCEIGEQDAE